MLLALTMQHLLIPFLFAFTPLFHSRNSASPGSVLTPEKTSTVRDRR